MTVYNLKSTQGRTYIRANRAGHTNTRTQTRAHTSVAHTLTHPLHLIQGMQDNVIMHEWPLIATLVPTSSHPVSRKRRVTRAGWSRAGAEK